VGIAKIPGAFIFKINGYDKKKNPPIRRVFYYKKVKQKQRLSYAIVF
jgi:hypothetical protein